MNMEQQLQILIQQGPSYNIPVAVMEKAVVPVIRQFASQLQHQEYYLKQALTGQLVVTKIVNLPDSQREKNVIYAFPTVRDTNNFQGNMDEPDTIAVPLPVTHILFQLFPIQDVDSIIFMEISEDLNSFVEVDRAYLYQIIDEQISQLSRPIPTDIA